LRLCFDEKRKKTPEKSFKKVEKNIGTEEEEKIEQK